MKSEDQNPKEEALELERIRGLGLTELAHYLRSKGAGAGDYTQDRHKWLDGLTVEDVLKQEEADKHTPSTLPKPRIKAAS